MTNRVNFVYAKIMSQIKENFDFELGMTGILAKQQGCWERLPPGVQEYIGHSARSAHQESDYRDNDTGRKAGLTLLLTPWPIARYLKCCEKLCEKYGVPHNAKEGPDTTRPYGPLIVHYPEYNVQPDPIP